MQEKVKDWEERYGRVCMGSVYFEVFVDMCVYVLAVFLRLLVQPGAIADEGEMFELSLCTK